MSELIKLTRDGDVAIITIDNPPVNAMSPGVPEGIQEAVRQANEDATFRAIVLIGAGRTFIAGADIREFGKIVSGEKPRLSLLPYLQSIEDSRKPVIVAIHGTALGGGLETAMSGHYRVIAPTAQIGQPEVKLGLIPGAGGTQRLPRLAGPAKAAEMCAFGEPISAKEAQELGVVDAIIEGDLLTGALAFARKIADQPAPKTRERNGKLQDVNAAAFDQLRDIARKTKRGQRAPLAAIDAVEAATKLPFAEGCKREAELFSECLFATESKASIHIFFGERTVAKVPGISKDVKLYDIKRAAVIGAGTMGGGIAMNFANAGIPVILKEAAQDALDRGLNIIRNNYRNTVAKGRLTQQAMEQRISLITPQLSYDGFEKADIIIEAVFEKMSVKKQVFSEIDKVAKPDCILASNTSSLDIDEIASATIRPTMVIGTHFFSPANVMKLLEVVRGKQTSSEVIATCMTLGKKLNKIAVLAGNARGFIGNRIIGPYLREAQFLVEEGASVEEVNQALYDFGMAMGPLAVDDLTGLDVSYYIRQEFKRFDKPGVRQPRVPDLLVESGRLGQKSGTGWSKYDQNR
ncbi:MAG TPA: 3-hydroxyacyl-CoA dehydrogenase NAD-binding domain-containing protein, partial [Bryobacteraceae bacterium]|nr:3-hydroxyacyl-CoA dehydrogenase NAD-binding domain-containing protein [Bryobacteraceae bacterium]